MCKKLFQSVFGGGEQAAPMQTPAAPIVNTGAEREDSGTVKGEAAGDRIDREASGRVRLGKVDRSRSAAVGLGM